MGGQGYVASWGNTRQVAALAAEAEGWGYESAWVAETAGYDVATLTPEQKKLFTDKNFVAIATVGKDGTPRNTIIWVDAEGDDIVVTFSGRMRTMWRGLSGSWAG